MAKRLSFLAIGSELLSGHVLESNSHWLQQKLRGTEVDFVSTLCVTDGVESILSGFNYLSSQSDIIVVCGGLGPTADDITREVMATFTSQKMIFDELAWQQVLNFFKGRKSVVHESNKKQAMRPKGSELLENERGSAPAFKLNHKNVEYYSFPGVPSEFKALSELYLLPDYVQEFNPDQFKLFGIGESELMDRLKSIKLIPDGFDWGTIANRDGITIKFPLQSRSHAEYKNVLKSFEKEFSEYIYTHTELNPVELLAHQLKEKKIFISTAESCTGGLLSAMLTEVSGSSAYVSGAIVAYQNEVKVKSLKVSTSVLEDSGAVSEACALEMAKGALVELNSDVAVSLTGIAGPTGGTVDKPRGTVCMAVVTHKGESVVKTYRFGGSREDVRERSCYAVALMALKLLKNE